MTDPLSEKQLEFIDNSIAKWNLAHGSVRSGKTVGTLFRFMQAVHRCPDSQIWMIGHTSSTIYDNAIRLILERPGPNIPDPFCVFRPFCTWFSGNRELRFGNKVINTVGAKDGGAIGAIQGKTFSLCYCDEMTLYPDSIIDMIDTRLSNPHSMGFASMNPSYPTHKLKTWIDKAATGDKNYYALQFKLEDNPYVDEAYKNRLKNSLSGVFYKRNYLGQWCLAEGSIFDFFDRSLYVRKRPPAAAEYFIAGIDYGTHNAFACIVIGVNTGIKTQSKHITWVEAEYFWDSKKKERQKTNAEYARDMVEFLEPYGVRSVYIDPSAASFKLEMRRNKIPVIDADNNVLQGIEHMISQMKDGHFFLTENCPNLIREMETYVWDAAAAKHGEDAPMKIDDHALDAARYALFTHKISKFDPEMYRAKMETQLRQQNNWGFR